MVFKLMTILGTRPEIIRLSCFIREADKYFNQILVHTGQNYDKNLKDIFFEEMKIRQPDYYLECVGKNVGETVGNIISKTYDLMLELKPDCVLVLGDTNSALAVYGAKRLKIPVFHCEASQRSFNDLLPEEVNRRLVDHISDINLCYSETARRNLIREGFRQDHLFVVSSPLNEVLNHYKEGIMASKILEKLNLEPNKYFVLSLHREQHVDDEKIFYQILDAIDKVCEKYKLPIVFSIHPRTQKKLNEKKIILNDLVLAMPAMGFFDYNFLQINALCVLSDSGSDPESSSILSFPAVILRDSIERQEAIDKGTIIMGNLKSETILDSINIAINTHVKNNTIIPYDYKDDNFSTRVIKIIQGYTPIINKIIWFKDY